MYYIVFIMRGAGIADELLTSSIQYIINVVMTLPAILYLDKFGRRPALLIGSFLMMTWLFTTGALQASYGVPNPDETDKDISWVVPREHSGVSKAIVACSYLFVASFATTWGMVFILSMLCQVSLLTKHQVRRPGHTQVKSFLQRSVRRLYLSLLV